jgi:predicted glycoside hydrolase/deacetylase ChbG (UPF0249 family)
LALVITADDLGIDPERDAGIIAAFERGAITQASLLVTGPNAANAARWAARAGCPLGLHLDLTEGPPSAPPHDVRSLLDGGGVKLGKHGLRGAIARGAVELAHVARETRAQLARFAALTGREAQHVDGHQHVHAIPELVELLAQMFAAAHVATTRIHTQRAVRGDGGAAHRFYEVVSREAVASREIYARYGVASTEAFTGLDTMGSASSVTALREAVRAASGVRSIELMCHPGHVGTAWDDFNRSPERQHELDVLLAAPFASLIADGRIVQSTFARLHREGALVCAT